ncbi:NAC domain-containing protein 96-like [Syzygium oleosum]|uniref:NAC domain-containing protein 96-like n=1 Tax=Syzygium oleosum TaxID=219896 RepID=UPI0024BA2437|nr:NAC domain-containing protein 96-like [Syzygium oleosum]
MGAAINPRDLPVGYRFHPTGEEFVNHYLKRRVLGYEDHPCIIPDVDICWCDPWELPKKFHGESIVGPDDQVQEWWFFSPHTSQKVKRSTPSGYWKKTGINLEVKARYTGTVIGTKKILVFHEGRGKNGDKTNWVIHEYHLLTNDLNRTHVLCHLKHERDEKADNSIIESERGAINLAKLEYDLHLPDREDLFPKALVQAKMNSLMELIQPKNRVESMADHQQQLQPARGSLNNCFPSNTHQLTNIGGPSVMDLSLNNSHADESIQLVLGTSEEDENVGDMQNADLADAVFSNRGIINQSYSPGFGVEARDRRTRQSLLEDERTTYASVPRSLPVPDRNTRARAMHGYPLNVNLL